jgi:hypothetical protein
VAHALLRALAMIDELIPAPRKVEETTIELAAAPEAV